MLFSSAQTGVTLTTWQSPSYCLPHPVVTDLPVCTPESLFPAVAFQIPQNRQLLQVMDVLIPWGMRGRGILLQRVRVSTHRFLCFKHTAILLVSCTSIKLKRNRIKSNLRPFPRVARYSTPCFLHFHENKILAIFRRTLFSPPRWTGVANAVSERTSQS